MRPRPSLLLEKKNYWNGKIILYRKIKAEIFPFHNKREIFSKYYLEILSQNHN